MKEKEAKNAELTERIMLLEKAANQLETDNRDLATQLREALRDSDGQQTSSIHEKAQLRGMSHLPVAVFPNCVVDDSGGSL